MAFVVNKYVFQRVLEKNDDSTRYLKTFLDVGLAALYLDRVNFVIGDKL